jgi:hypothetical protein
MTHHPIYIYHMPAHLAQVQHAGPLAMARVHHEGCDERQMGGVHLEHLGTMLLLHAGGGGGGGGGGGRCPPIRHGSGTGQLTDT